MRIAILSDVHANLPALEAVLNRITAMGTDLIYCLGDSVGYGPNPEECVQLLREHCTVVLKGNHDCGLIGETPLNAFNQFGQKAIIWSREVVTSKTKDFIRGLPYTSGQGTMTLVHASPVCPDSWQYVLTMQAARECFGAFTTELCFIGHTHVPVIIGEDMSVNCYRTGVRFIINVGSVGQPRDGNPSAAFGHYDTEQSCYELIRVPYDVEKTAQAIRDAGLPEFLAQRLTKGI